MKHTHIMQGAAICFLAAVFLLGCGKDTMHQSTDNQENGDTGTEKEDLQDEKASISQIKALGEETEKDWLSLEEELRPSIVEIFCGDSHGSGIVWEVTEKQAAIASAGHLLKKAETCDIVCYKGTLYTARVEEILEGCDIGFAYIPIEALEEDGAELMPVVPCERGMEELTGGEELAIYGSMDYIAGNFVKGYLIEAESELELPIYEEKQTLLLGGVQKDMDETAQEKTEDGKDTEIDAGMSGSGVFDRQGHLLGILVGGDGEEHFAAVPVWKILDR